MTLKPVGCLRIEHLKTIGVVDQPLDHQSKSPDHQEYQDRKDDGGRDDRDDDGQRFCNSLLQRALKRPGYGDCKQSECHRRDDCMRKIQSRQNNNRGQEQERISYDAIVLQDQNSSSSTSGNSTDGSVDRNRSQRLKARMISSANMVRSRANRPAMSAADTQLAGPPVIWIAGMPACGVRRK